jgi:hypothetical protein
MTQNLLKCNLCEAIFTESSQLIDHYIQEHPDSPEAQRIRFAKIKIGWDRV